MKYLFWCNRLKKDKPCKYADEKDCTVRFEHGPVKLTHLPRDYQRQAMNMIENKRKTDINAVDCIYNYYRKRGKGIARLVRMPEEEE